MVTLTSKNQRQIELYADGVLVEQDRQQIEELLRTNAEAQAYLQAMQELTVMSQSAIEWAQDAIDFDRLEDAIMHAIETDTTLAPAHSPRTSTPATHGASPSPSAQELAKWMDQELDTPEDIQRVYSTLAQNAQARSTVDTLRAVRYATKAYVQDLDAHVDFHALEQRSFDATVSTTAAEHASRAPVTSFGAWMHRLQTPMAALAGVAAATALLLPLSLGTFQSASSGDRMHVDEVHVEPGFSGRTSIGKSVPKVWISDDATTAPTSPTVKEPRTEQDEDDEDNIENKNEHTPTVTPKNPK